ARVSAAARRAGLRVHLDGARIWNAVAATGHSEADYAQHADTVSCCFSKGLGAPCGSAVAGDRATIARVFRFRKMFGGAMRQAGLLAAAALHALDHHRERLADDHANARALADGLAAIPGLQLAMPVPTNMVFFDLDAGLGPAAAFCARLKELGVLVLATTPRRVRAVCHLDVSAAHVRDALTIIARAASEAHRPAERRSPGRGLAAHAG
ncbi:MAG TPA: beta-eliminating lyase-related protein, partial [Phycisphaerales bacterium]|nr:beta-eliminating lyase-related protein [Phycisphaerales bacterium]